MCITNVKKSGAMYHLPAELIDEDTASKSKHIRRYTWSCIH